MTNEELCLRYQASDTDAAEELITQNMGLIRSIALRYDHEFQNARMDADDYTQEGTMALLRAAYQYDPAKQVPFLSYAGQAIRNAIIDAIRTDNPGIVITLLDESHTTAADDNDGDEGLSIGRMKSRLPSSYETDPETIYIRKNSWKSFMLRSKSFLPGTMPGFFADMALMMMYINRWRKWEGCIICPRVGRRKRRMRQFAS